MCEIHAEPRSFGQDKRRRINNIHNQSYFDTVEVIGSIPVAPTIAFPSFSLNQLAPFEVALNLSLQAQFVIKSCSSCSRACHDDSGKPCSRL